MAEPANTNNQILQQIMEGINSLTNAISEWAPGTGPGGRGRARPRNDNVDLVGGADQLQQQSAQIQVKQRIVDLVTCAVSLKACLG